MSRWRKATVRTHNHRPEPALNLVEPIPTAPLVLPWPCLAHDNHRLCVIHGQMRLSNPYRKAKEQIARRAELWWRRSILAGDVHLLARFWFPDLRKRDAGNYRKALLDALSGVVYGDDQQVIDERYVRVDIDRANPRCEVWISDAPISLEACAA